MIIFVNNIAIAPKITKLVCELNHKFDFNVIYPLTVLKIFSGINLKNSEDEFMHVLDDDTTLNSRVFRKEILQSIEMQKVNIIICDSEDSSSTLSFYMVMKYGFDQYYADTIEDLEEVITTKFMTSSEDISGLARYTQDIKTI